MNKQGQTGWAVAGVALLIFFAIIGFMGFDKVEPNHMGVMVHFGTIEGEMQPGLKWTGIFTDTHQYDMKIRQVKVDMLDAQSSAIDKTGQIVFGSVSVNYRLKRDKGVVTSLYESVGEDKVIASVLNIKPIIKEGFKQATAKYDALDIIENRQEVKELAQENIRRNFPQEYFQIVDIVVEDIDFTEDFKKAIEAKKTATQLALKAEADLSRVQWEQKQEIEKYKAEAEKLRLQKSQVTPLLNQQKWIEKWDGTLPQFVIASQDSANMILQLPNMQAEENQQK